MFFTDTAEDPVGIGSVGSGLNPSLPKSTMTLGRAGVRIPYGVRVAVMGSSPNINTGGGGGSSGVMPSDAIAFGSELQNQPSQAATVPHSMRQVSHCCSTEVSILSNAAQVCTGALVKHSTFGQILFSAF